MEIYLSQYTSAAGRQSTAPVHDHKRGCTVSQCGCNNKNMEDLVATPNNIKRTWFKPLRDPGNIESCANGIHKPHGDFIGKSYKNLVVGAEEDGGVGGRDDTGEPHC